MQRIIASTIFLFLLLAGSAFAQQIDSPFEYIEETQSLGVFGGYLWTAAGVQDIGPQSMPLFGARYNIRFTGPVSGEASLSLGPTQRNVVHRVATADPDQPFQIINRGEASALFGMLEGGVRFHLTGPRTWYNLAPFLVGTGGLAGNMFGDRAIEEEFDIPEDQQVRFGPALAVGIGAGTDWFPAPRLSLRLEVRDQIWRLTTPEQLLLPDQEEGGRWTNNIGLSVGAAYHF